MKSDNFAIGQSYKVGQDYIDDFGESIVIISHETAISMRVKMLSGEFSVMYVKELIWSETVNAPESYSERQQATEILCAMMITRNNIDIHPDRAIEIMKKINLALEI